MKKAFDQTVRDLKREVNKKVLKVPGIEQKILDATSNEPWGPHGSYLAEIAHATRNSHEYYLIMSVIWKRINDIGKNWRHVYKGLTVLEYLLAHGSECVIEDIREHTYQISTLADFQYIDSHGRDQGNNVRKKSQILVALVNDREMIQEVRQKAFSNKDKYGGSFSTGGMHRSASGGSFGDRYGDDRYKGEDHNGYSQERDDDRYGRNGDSYNNDGDCYGRDVYRDNDRQGRTRNDGYQFGSRSRSAGGDRDRSFDDDDRYSSRSGGGHGDDSSHDDRRYKLPEHSVDAPPPPPSYEEVVKSTQIHIEDERDGKTSPGMTDSSTKVVSPPPPKLPPKVLYESTDSTPATATATTTSSLPNKIEDADFDEFDPRSSTTPTPTPAFSNNVEMDLFGSFSVDDSINSLALVPMMSLESDVPIQSSDSATNFVAVSSTTSIFNQADDPFGDAPFKATSQDNLSALSVNGGGTVQSSLAMAVAELEPSTGFGFTESFLDTTAPSTIPSFQQQPSATPPVMTTTQSTEDLLDSILNPYNGLTQPMPPALARSQTAPPEFFAQSPNPFAEPGVLAQMFPPTQYGQPGVSAHMHPQTQFTQQLGLPSAASSPNLLSYSLPAPMASPTSSLPPIPTQSTNKPKFETKSTVWTDTLSRGLIDLNISGSKTNKSEVDIGVDFDSINRKEKLKGKKNISMAAPMSTVTMGKAMGSGYGIGHSVVTGLARPPTPMMPPPSMGTVVGTYGGGYAGGMNQAMGMAPGYGMPQGTGVGYNPMMGIGGGGYGSQQPYGGGGAYRSNGRNI